MGGILTALNSGKTGLFASQKAIEVTGNNINNVNTEGYSRQKIELSPYPALDLNGFFIGHGVKVSGIVREHDAFLTSQLQTKNVSLGEETGKADSLTELERVFNIGEQNLATVIDRFFAAWQTLAANPGSTVERNMVIQQGGILANAFHSTSAELDSIRSDTIDSIVAKTADINRKLQTIADLNQQISGIAATGLQANSLLDQRDLLLNELAYSLGVRSYDEGNNMVSVQLPGGLSLVQGGSALTLKATQAGNDIQLTLTSGATTLNLKSSDLGGEFKGMLYMTDEYIPALLDNLDKLAYTISNSVNTQHQAGVGLDNIGARDFFTPLALQQNASRNISVDITDSNQIAAGASSASGDNTNAMLLTALGAANLIDGTDTFTGFYGRMAADLGIDASQNKLTLSGTEDSILQLQNLRDSRVGVSLEEEMINLIRYQKSFEASAKLLSTVEEMMTTILMIKG